MKSTCSSLALSALLLASSLGLARGFLIQPYNYMLDDAAMLDGQESMSPLYADQAGPAEHNADKDIVKILGEGLARLRFARMLQHQQQHQSDQSDQSASDQYAAASEPSGEPSKQEGAGSSMLLNVAQAAAQAMAAAAADDSQLTGDAAQNSDPDNSNVNSNNNNNNNGPIMTSRGSIMELDTSAGSSSAGAQPSKADLKTTTGTSQWFNPKETYPMLKISSMATPSKYKKVYFRSEKKLVDGAFHSPSRDQDEKKSFMRPFNSGVQRRSSRRTSGLSASAAPPSVLNDGVVEFLKKFRDVYVQTRPAGANGAASNLGSMSSIMAAASPLVAVLAPSQGSGSRPNLASAISAATSMANTVAQAAAANSQSVSSGSGSTGSGAGAAAAAAVAAASGAANPSKSPLTAQSYVSFWSKTFPSWVRKMLKQLRRRSLQNSSKRQKQHQHQHVAAIGQAAQAAASSAMASAVDQAISTSGSSNSASSSS